MADKNFQQVLLEELQLLLQPLANAAANEDIRNDLFEALGWDVDQIDGFPIGALNTALTEFANGFAGLSDLIETPPEGIKGLADTLLATEHVVLGAMALSRVFEGSGNATPENFEKLGAELVDHLATSWLRVHHPFAFHLLWVLTVVDETVTPATLGPDGRLLRPPVSRFGLHLVRIPSLITDPVGTLKAAYGLTNGITDPVATSNKLFPRLLFFIEQVGAEGAYGFEPELQVTWDFGPAGTAIAERTLTVFKALPTDDGTRTFGVGTGIVLDTELGVILRPLGTFDFTVLLGEWAATLHAVVQAEGVAIDANDVTIPEGAAGGINATLELERLPEPDENGNPLAFLVGSATGTRLEVGEFFVILHANLAPAALDFGFQIDIRHAQFVISAGDGDGFLQKFLPSEMPIVFDLAIGWSKQRGLHFSIGAGLHVVLPVHVSLGDVLDIDTIELGIQTDGQAVDLLTTATFTAHIGGVVDAVAQQVGLKSHITFPPESGNLGPLNADLEFQLPRGIGIVVHAGAITGGGFIFLSPEIGRYAGVLELSVYGVGVKAFGLIETRLPDGTAGFSFVIVIVAEFTPIQLGFGFTLLGVGGIIGIDRSVNEQALGDAVRTGSLAHLLFPRNPVQDAPAIIHDLATVFPASRGHYIFGPMAKLGWGTPTLISADLGIVIEFPGPRLAVLGVVRMLLPSPEFALLRFQLAVLGLLDFPARTFSLDASLFDSTVAGYVVTGDMAYRLGFGANASFLLSVGGFNPGFQAPPAYPELRRASVDLGVSGNPSLVASGYFALTSNTAQIGAKIELRASGFGIRLEGHLGFDVLFVFSPFSFTASISAGVRVSFHGVGFGITLRGSLSGPTPWHVKGRVCVSVLWWDACLPIDVKFGRAEPAALPEMDPWEGTPPVTPPEVVDPRIQVLGLRDAIVEPRNWSGSAPPAGFSVVSLAEAATAERTPIDPLGAATLRQKVVPLRRDLEKFGEYKPIAHTRFDSVAVAINDVPESNVSFVEDKFAPAHFTELSGAQRLSMPSYELMDAGFSIAPDRVTAGTVGSATLEYETAFITAAGERFADAPGDEKFKLTHEQLLAQLERSASALGGMRRAGSQRFMLPLERPKKVVLARETFVVADSCSHVKHAATGTYTSRSQALLALRAHERSNPTDVNRFDVIPQIAVRAA